MKEIKPTIKHISQILKKQVGGWNDKRVNYNRIKLMSPLSLQEQSDLLCGLKELFPTYQFECDNVPWVSPQFTKPRMAFALKYWKNK